MNCDLCLHESKPFFDLGRQPMANKYPLPNEYEKEQFFDIKVYFCPNCKNIQLDTKVSRETMFVDYYYLSSVNKSLVDHYTKFAHTLKDARFVVDIGSNDGVSLKPLKEMGVKCLGVEPSINVSKIANDAGLETMCAFFNAESAKEIERKYGKPDVITGLSMFSHLQDPHTFLEDVKSLLSDDGKFIVEVEYNLEIINKRAFERFYLDRIFYFSVTSFDKLFQRHGMVLTDVELTPAHGGSLRVTAQKKGFRSVNVLQLLDVERTKLNEEEIKFFELDCNFYVASLRRILVAFNNAYIKVAAYGCPARTSTITNLGKIDEELLEFIVDDSPLKQGKTSPGMHIPIVSSQYLEEHPVDVLIVFAYDYIDDIKKRLTRPYVLMTPIPPRFI